MARTFDIGRFLSLDCSQVLSAPNILRVGATENIFVECQDCTEDMKVSIKVVNFPTKVTTLASTSVNLNSGNKYQALGQIKVNNLFGSTVFTCFRCSLFWLISLFWNKINAYSWLAFYWAPQLRPNLSDHVCFELADSKEWFSWLSITPAPNAVGSISFQDATFIRLHMGKQLCGCRFFFQPTKSTQIDQSPDWRPR